MQNEQNLLPGEKLRQAMRHWVTGVAIVTSQFQELRHGMTVNSFGSISLDPPLVVVTMNNNTRTYAVVQQSNVFAVTVLSHLQQPIADLFAGRLMHEPEDRFAGLDVFTMQTGSPLLMGGMAFIDCRVVQQIPMLHSTLFVGEVLEAQHADAGPNGEALSPLLYYNRKFLLLD